MVLKMRSKSPIAIKICGITQIKQAKAIAEMGINALGVIGVKNSPRFVNEVQRRELFKVLFKSAPQVKRVLVLADPNDVDLESILKGNGTPSVIQLHGDESKERCRNLRKNYPNIEFWKAIRIRTQTDIYLANIYGEIVDSLLLDAWSPKTLGGTGRRLPLEWIEKANLQYPWWLAGGISSEWIPEVLRRSTPHGIDASSKLEISPGIKDLNKVSSLIKSARNIQKK